jgi:hypothetical protein
MSTNTAGTTPECPIIIPDQPTKPRRNRPGTKEADCNTWLECPFEQIQSPLRMQEYLQDMIRTDRSNISRLLQVPPGQDENVWQLEHLRLVCLELNYLVIHLEPECNKETCPEMKADEWLYLCAAHIQPQPVSHVISFKFYIY